MFFPDNIKIRHKLLLIIMLTCIGSLVSAGSVFVIWEWRDLRRTLRENLLTQAQMVADTCTAAIAFKDGKDAEQTLRTLSVEPTIVYAGIVTKEYKEFASYYRNGAARSVRPQTFLEDGHIFHDGYLTVFKSVVLDGEKLGVVCIRSSLKPMYRALLHSAGSLIGVLFLVSLAAYIVSLLLQRIISRPILSMAESATRIGKGELSHRVEVQSNDELGYLARSFNEMTEKLAKSYAELEKMIKERTAELSAAKEKLEREMGGRSEAQAILHHRVKQLHCLYGLSKLVEQPQIGLEQMFQETTHLVRYGHQYPDETCVRITFDGIQYKTDNFRKTEVSQYAELKVEGEKDGAVEVYYLGEKPRTGGGPFLKEERDLIHAVAEQLNKIAEHRKAEERLELFRNLIDGSNDCIFAIEPKWGLFLDVNDRACESLGYTRKELLKMSLKNVEESIPTDSSWLECVEQLEAKGDIMLSGRHRRKDGTAYFAETSLKLVSQGKDRYVIAVSRDITERKGAEERQAKLLRELESVNSELKDFAYIVSHDLKAPLRGIGTLAEWIATDHRDKLGDKGKEQIDLLMGRVRRMHNLIDGVLQYSRVGRIKEEQVLVNLNELVAEVIDIIAAPEHISITIENELAVVECEKTRITQVFQNLLSNAVKYMDKPQGLIKIGCVDDGDFWKFSVADNGPGIDKKHFEKIFRIFQTLAPRDKFESTGIGLTVVKKIVELYDGRIWLESELGKGTTFYFTWPKQKTEITGAKLEANIVS